KEAEKMCAATEQAYKRRLAIEGVAPGVGTVDRRIPSQACDHQGVDSVLVLRTPTPGFPSTAIRCKEASAPPPAAATESGEPLKMYGLNGSFTDVVTGFVT